MAFSLTRALSSMAEGKALGVHPVLQDRTTPVSIVSPGANRQGAVISQREAMRHTDAYGGQQAIDWVYDAIGLYADPTAASPYRLEREDGTKLVRKRTDGTPPDHEEGPKALYDLLDKPNPFMLYDELVSLLVVDLLLVGNAYWMKWQTTTDGRPLALYRLAPSHVKIKPGAQGPQWYEYQPPGSKKIRIQPDDVIHFRRPNPHSAYYGMGVIQGAGRAMDLELAITDTMASYYENRADPSLIVQSERRVPKDVFNQLRVQLRQRVAGSSRAGELLVLQNGLKASTLSPSASEALFEELAKMSRDRVLGKFRASPRLLGMDSSGSNGGDKVADIRREFDNYALRPFMNRVEGMVTAALTAAWGCTYHIDYRQVLPAEEAIKVGESIASIPGVKVREIRKQYEQFGIEESTGDPEIDNLIVNVPTLELGPNGTDANGNAGPADAPLSSEAGRPPKPENTVAFGTAKVIDVKAIDDAIARLEAKAVINREDIKPSSTKLPGERRPNDSFESARAADIDAISASLAEELRAAATTLERGLLDHVEGKALKTSDLVARIRRSPAWTAFRTQVESALESAARRAASSGVMHSGLEPEDDIDYDALVKSVVHRPEGIRGIVATLRDRVVGRIKDARGADAERHDYEAAVREVISEWQSGQAVTVAETEAVHAYNEATLTAAELSGVESVYVTDGDDHDEPCVEANGSVWTIAHARENRLEHPRCRRAFLPLTASAVS